MSMQDPMRKFFEKSRRVTPVSSDNVIDETVIITGPLEGKGDVDVVHRADCDDDPATDDCPSLREENAALLEEVFGTDPPRRAEPDVCSIITAWENRSLRNMPRPSQKLFREYAARLRNEMKKAGL